MEREIVIKENEIVTSFWPGASSVRSIRFRHEPDSASQINKLLRLMSPYTRPF